MSCFNAITDNTKYVLPCDRKYCMFPTQMELFPGYDSKCCCVTDFDVQFCKSDPVAIIKNGGSIEHPKYTRNINPSRSKKCCGRL